MIKCLNNIVNDIICIISFDIKIVLVVFILTFYTFDKIEIMGEQLQSLKEVSDMLSYHNEKVIACTQK